MDTITILTIITVTGVILLLGLFGVCLGYAYLTVRAESEQTARPGETGGRSTGESDTGDTGDFVFGTNDETPGTADPRQQL